MLLAAGMFAACSDNLEDAGAGNAGGEIASETGYVKIAINLPTTSANSRAESFDDGLAVEYKVNNLILALFHGQTEGEATCKQAFTISPANFGLVGETTDNITSTFTDAVREIISPSNGDNVYALAIVNNSGYFQTADATPETTVGAAKVQVLQTKLEGTSFTTFNGKLSDLQKAIDVNISTIAKTDDGGNFLMTNAPTADIESPTSSTNNLKVSTLVPLTIYTTEAAAEDGDANNIYLERVVAKVEVKVTKKPTSGTDNTIVIDDKDSYYNGASVLFTKWSLNTTNKKTYLVRKVQATSSETSLNDWEDWKGYFAASETPNRFFGTTSNPYRVYWGIDPNYTQIATGEMATNFNVYTKESSNTPWKNIGAVDYCAENTTTATDMYKDQLTGVLIEATFTPANSTDGANFFMINQTSAIYTEEEFLTVVKASLGLTAETSISISDSYSEPKTITSIDNLKKLITIPEGTTVEDAKWNQLLSDVGNEVKFYKNGVTYYYTTFIKHFGTTDISPTVALTEKDHLGHTGVVRNNWYELNINNVTGPGEPDIPEIPHEPINEGHSYIKCAINVLSWARRTQNVGL